MRSGHWPSLLLWPQSGCSAIEGEDFQMFTKAEFEARLERLRNEMARHDVAAMIVDHTELMAWLSGYIVSETLYRGMIVPESGEPWIILRKIDEDACRRTSWIGNVIGFGDSEDSVEIFANLLRDLKLNEKRIGADFNSYGFTAAVHQRFTELLPQASFVNMCGASDQLRIIKSEEEIEHFRRVALIADDTMNYLASSLDSEDSSRSAYAKAASRMVLLGADSGDAGPIVKSDPSFEAVHGGLSCDPLRAGGLLNVELIPRVAGYSARLIRPMHVGKPSADLHQAAKRLIELQDRQIAAIRPGCSAGEVDSILRDPMIEEGLRDPFTNVTGYTLGIYGRTQRIADFSYSLHPKASWVIEPGMVLHMCVFGQRLGFSETIVVTENGSECLTSVPRRILQIQ